MTHSRHHLSSRTKDRDSLPDIPEILFSWIFSSEPEFKEATRAWTKSHFNEAQFQIQLHGIAQILYHQLHTLPSWEAWPIEFKQYLFDQFRLNEMRIQKISATLNRVLTALDRAGVTVCPLKGSHLLLTSNRNPALRPMADIDLLIHSKDLDRTTNVLKSLNLQLVESMEQHAIFGTPATPVSFDQEHPDNPISIEIHTSIVFRFLGLNNQLFDLSEPIRSTCHASLEGYKSVVLMNKTAFLLHLGCHFAHHLETGTPRAIQLIDLVTAARDCSDAQWVTLLDMTRATRSERLMYAALSLLSRYGHVEIPSRVMSELAAASPFRLRDVLAHASLADFAVDNESKQMKQMKRHAKSRDFDSFDRVLSFIHRISMKRVIWFDLNPAWPFPGNERLLMLQRLVFPGLTELIAWYPNWMKRAGARVTRIVHVVILLSIPWVYRIPPLKHHRKLGVIIRQRRFRRTS